MINQKIILLHEDWVLSAKRDAFSVLCAFAMIAPGYLIGSAALQWIGAGFLLIVCSVRAAGVRKTHERTLDQAQAEIAAMIAERDAK